MMRARSRRLRRLGMAMLGLSLFLGGTPVSRSPAQIPGGQADNGQPMQIQADSGIEWQQDQHLYIARGNAVATRGAGEVHADMLIAHYREAKSGNTGGNSEIYRVDAEGHVTVKRDAQTAVGDNAGSSPGRRTDRGVEDQPDRRAGPRRGAERHRYRAWRFWRLQCR